MATSSTVVTPTTALLKWMSPVDAEDVFEGVFNRLNGKFIQEGVAHCCHQDACDERIVERPPDAHYFRRSYPTRKENHDKSVLKMNEQSSKAMGLLINLFDPTCNAHRELAAWFAAAIPGLDAVQRMRGDFHFRNAWENWLERYKPNKQSNLQALRRQFDALTDATMSFAEFVGMYRKLYADMEEIGVNTAPTLEHCYEMLRKNVTNPNLKPFVLKLGLPEARRTPIEEFLEDCLYVVQNSPELDSGPSHKRKADEEIVGRQALVSKARRVNAADAICWRCGKRGHLKNNYETGVLCRSSVCTLCDRNIEGREHDARRCCAQSQVVFGTSQKSDSKARGGSNGRQPNSSQRRGKRGKRGPGQGNPSQQGSNQSSTSTSASVPNGPISAKQAAEYRAKLAVYDATQKIGAHRVSSREDEDSRA